MRSLLWHIKKKKGRKQYDRSGISLELLSELWKKQNGKCALTGKRMTHLRGVGKVRTNVSIDRIDSNLGYTENNVRLTCVTANLMRQNLTDIEMVEWCSKVIEKLKGGYR